MRIYTCVLSSRCFSVQYVRKESEIAPAAAAAAKSLQSCLTLCSPIDSSPPGSPVHGILQARVLEWVPLPSPGAPWARVRSVVFLIVSLGVGAHSRVQIAFGWMDRRIDGSVDG